MSRSGLLRRADVLAVMRVLADVAAVKGNAAVQHATLLNGLGRVLEVHTSGLFVADGFRPGEDRVMRQMIVGDNPDARWLQYLADFNTRFPFTDDPYTDHIYRCDDPAQLWTMGRVIPDHPDSHRRYGPAMQVIRDLRLRDGMIAAIRVGPGLSRTAGVAFHRLSGESRFTLREQRVLAFAGEELRDLAERGHFQLIPGSPGTTELLVRGLSPRGRQVLGLLLSGKPPKEIAWQLNLSIWTIRDHLKVLYAHFGVSGRDELMALFIQSR